MSTALRLHDVTKTVALPRSAPLHILRGVNLTVGAGETVSISGKSGSGKTTLLSIMGLLSEPSSGSVVIGDTESVALKDSRRSDLRNSALGFVFQSYSLVPTWSALQNCQLPLLYRKQTTPSRSRELAKQQLIRLGLGDRLDAYPRQLSGGEQQRVAIARALVTRPSVVLADEPTGALDEATAETVLEILMGAVIDEGCSLVLVTHDSEVARRAHSHYRLHDGTLSQASA